MIKIFKHAKNDKYYVIGMELRSLTLKGKVNRFHKILEITEQDF